MSAINKPSAAMDLILTPKLNELLFSYMQIDDLERMKLVSKKIPHAPIENVVRVRVYKAIPEDNLWKSIGGLDALRGVRIRNFPAPIQTPLSNYPGRCMAGFQQTDPGVFQLYQFERNQFVAEARLACLPNWVQYQFATLHVQDKCQIYQNEAAGCEFLAGTGPGCLAAIRFISLSLFECCCFKKRPPKWAWQTTFEENGGKYVEPRTALEHKDESPDVADCNASKWDDLSPTPTVGLTRRSAPAISIIPKETKEHKNEGKSDG